MGPLEHYRGMIARREIEADPAQALAMEKLQLLANRLAAYQPPSQTDWFSFFTRKRGEVPKGLYLVGGVGRGKTMLMDLFFDHVPFEAKRRVHFHAFMEDVHARIAETRKTHDGDPIEVVASDLAKAAQLLCFDEFAIEDIADAMIIGRLFEKLFDAGVVVVATSNVAPNELYHNGLNRALFLPFIALLEETVEVLVLEAQKDYRLEKLSGTPLYFVPGGKAADAAMFGLWRQLSGVETGAAVALDVKGRQVHVPEAHLGVARFGFADICERELAAGDYLEIARRFHTVFVADVPMLGRSRPSPTRRFINLIDVLYDSGIKLVVSAAAEPDDLYEGGDEAFVFQRTASRLIEMRSQAYLTGDRS